MRLRVTYHLACSSRLAAATARDIAFEQTVVLPADSVSPEVAARVAGRVESVASLGRGRSRAVISFDPLAVCGDLRNEGLVEGLFAAHPFDVVFHCAAILAHAASDRRLLWTSNVDAGTGPNEMSVTCSSSAGVDAPRA